jgi:hypothetical protein
MTSPLKRCRVSRIELAARAVRKVNVEDWDATHLLTTLEAAVRGVFREPSVYSSDLDRFARALAIMAEAVREAAAEESPG